MASRITGVCSIICSSADKRKHQSSLSLAFLTGIPSQRVSNAENVSIWWRHHCRKTNHVNAVRIVISATANQNKTKFYTFYGIYCVCYQYTPLDMMASWMRTFSGLLTLFAGNSLVTGEFPSQRPAPRSFDVFFDLRLNKRLSKQSRCRWNETQLRSLWRQCNEKFCGWYGLYTGSTLEVLDDE